MTEIQQLQKLKIKALSSRHQFKIGDTVIVQRIIETGNSFTPTIFICRHENNEKNIWAITPDDFEVI